MNKEQQEYVLSELALGVTPQKIKSDLMGAGYTDEQATELLDFAQNNQSEANQLSDIPQAQTEVKKSAAPRVIFYACLLLVVLGAIGFIANSLNSARDSANDAIAKQGLNNLRVQAEVYSYSELEPESYAGFCDSTVVRTATFRNESLDCQDSVEQYRISVQLLDGDYYCIDNGNSSLTLESAPAGLSCQ